ncbi:hypothetical protein HKX48_001185 [Thoreauomyces humboldtii]|nr:hypothetical protein HKX48_001185 [Thoreauomyces humboldtii]
METEAVTTLGYEDADKFLICEYCNALFAKLCPDEPKHDCHDDSSPERPVPLIPETSDKHNNDADEGFPCFTCNSRSNRITASQRDKHGWKARCFECVAGGHLDRLKRFDVFKLSDGTMAGRLDDAVVCGNIETVEELLAEGADPNGSRQLRERDDRSGRYLPVWRHDRTVFPDLAADQPTTPLTGLVFGFMDLSNSHEHFDRLTAVARLLIKAGADQAPAIAYAKSRYGEGCFEPFREDFIEEGEASLEDRLLESSRWNMLKAIGEGHV